MTVEQRRPELDRELHLGHRRRRPALRARQIQRRDPADDRAAPPRRGAGDTKQAVVDMKTVLDAAGVVKQDAALRQAADQVFYNTSRFTLTDLRAHALGTLIE